MPSYSCGYKNRFFYINIITQQIIMIVSNKKPSLNNEPKSGAWIVREYYDGGWFLPSFPELPTPNLLRNFLYIGKLDAKSIEEKQKDNFKRHLKKCSNEVKTWPKWKQNLMGEI